MQYAPENELGVVFLFSHFLKKYRLRVEKIGAAFPDCIAYQKTGWGEKRIRIEFELRSRNFKTHRHSVKNCDWIVCWEHNWPECPKKLTVIELRKQYGLGFNVWIQPLSAPYSESISKLNKAERWTVNSQASSGDLILYYLTRPDKCIRDIFKIAGPVQYMHDSWKIGKDFYADAQRVCSLPSPVFWEDIQNHRILKTASFVRGTMQGRPRATEYWPHLYELIVRRNPGVIKKLSQFSPENI